MWRGGVSGREGTHEGLGAMEKFKEAGDAEAGGEEVGNGGCA